MAVQAAWLLPTGQTREDTRAAPVGAMTPTGPVVSRDGVIPGGAPFAASAGGAMAVTIGVGRALVQGTAAQGAYPVAVTAPETLALEDGEGMPRLDTVALRVYDGLYDTSGQSAAALVVVKGTPGATPVSPVLPPTTLPLWDIRVPAGASAAVGGIPWATALTDRRRYTVAVGGIVPPGGSSSWSGSYAGQYRDRSGVLERWTGSGWTTYRAPAESPAQIDSGFTLATGWSLNSFYARKSGRVVTTTVYIKRTGSPISDKDNIPDTELGRLPANWRPEFNMETMAGDGHGHGSVLVESDGLMTLRSWSPNVILATNNNLRCSATFVQ
ncbi:hypothetical protein ACSMX9_22550 [Streptomyces sp. LE64]|uniref:hypothetical protein n=1 Tax=Streptomyces sp. LE64 TaxID=3448653 RepID=UPI004040EE05